MRKMLIAIAVALVLGPGAAAEAQILDTLTGFEARSGWQGRASLSLRLGGGNTEVQDYLATAAGQWEGDRHRVRLIGGYDFSRADGSRQREDLTAHLRHNYRLLDRLHSLAFVQHQRNPFQDLDARDLLGAGVRYDLKSADTHQLALGLSAMYEFEELSGDGRSEAMRLSTFVDWHAQPRGHIRLGLTGWYQPRLSDFADTRASVAADLDVDLAGPFGLLVTWAGQYDSRPPDEIEEFDWTLRTGLRVSL